MLLVLPQKYSFRKCFRIVVFCSASVATKSTWLSRRSDWILGRPSNDSCNPHMTYTVRPDDQLALVESNILKGPRTGSFLPSAPQTIWYGWESHGDELSIVRHTVSGIAVTSAPMSIPRSHWVDTNQFFQKWYFRNVPPMLDRMRRSCAPSLLLC